MLVLTISLRYMGISANNSCLWCAGNEVEEIQYLLEVEWRM